MVFVEYDENSVYAIINKDVKGKSAFISKFHLRNPLTFHPSITVFLVFDRNHRPINFEIQNVFFLRSLRLPLILIANAAFASSDSFDCCWKTSSPTCSRYLYLPAPRLL